MKLKFGIKSLVTLVALLALFSSSVDAVASDGFPSSSETVENIFAGVKWSNPVEELLNERSDHHRNLQDLPPKIPAMRSCGQIINIATVDQIKQVASIVVNLLLGESPAAAAFALSTVEAILTHDVQAQVVCGSCNEVRELAGGDDFETYCNENLSDADTEYSSILLIPFDPDTGKAKEGILKTHLYGKTFATISQHAPTEFWTEDFDVWNTTDRETLGGLYSVFYDGWGPLLIASSGVVTISPDYSGFGQTSVNSPKLAGYVGMYQQVFAIAFLKSKQIVESTGCTLLSNKFSASGYSEGGFGTVVGANALIGLGQKPLNVDTGGGPFNTSLVFANAIFRMDNGTLVGTARDQIIHGAGTFSSKNPDLPNSNLGQNALSDEWVGPLNDATNADIPFLELEPFLPDNIEAAFNPVFLENTRTAISELGILDACVVTTPGVDDLLCQALRESDVLQLVQETTFPISICHSPDDMLVPRSGHAPNVSANPLLSERTVFGFAPEGPHVVNSAFCTFGFVVQFTLDSELGAAEPLEDPTTCGTVAPAAPSSPNDMTGAPVSIPVTVAPADVTASPTMSPTPEPSTAASSRMNFIIALVSLALPAML